jgi:hypothetical protein
VVAVTDGPRIGLLRERPLHASLKRWYAQPGDRIEVPVDGYVIDLVRGDHLVEFQTRGFSGLRPKVGALLGNGHRLRIVLPIARDRWIIRVGDDGAVIDRRRSPRHGIPADLAAELVSFPELLSHPGFELEVLMTREEEHRRKVPGRCWRRHGWMVTDRRLLEVLERIAITRPADLARLLPAGLPERFTTADLAARLGRPRRIAQQLAYCLAKAGLVEVVDRRGRSLEYRISGETTRAARREGPTPPGPENGRGEGAG